MPAARGVKRTASKASTASSSSGPKNKKKRTVVQLAVPTAPTKSGCVLTCGQGDVGQLGLGMEVFETTKFKFVPTLGHKIVDACAGGMHSVALDCDGNVWTFGCNDEGALGRTTRGDKDEGTPGRVALPAPAVAITAGDSHTAALLHNGDVYAWGAFRDSHGSMGLVVQGREGKTCKDPAHIPIGEQAANIASGGDHLVVLTVSGSVLTMGCGEQGQLGRLSQRSTSRDTRQGFSALLVPSKVVLKPGASRVWAGYHATFALDAAGEKMYAWGLNNHGQLGISGEKRRPAVYTPLECDAFSRAGGDGGRWARVACGQHHTLAVDAAGACYALGRCEYGRLGLGEGSGDAESLEPIPALSGKRCVSISAGTCNSFAVTDTGEVFAWGMGSEGQLGTGAQVDEVKPRSVTLSAPGISGGQVVRASAGGQHTMLLIEDAADKKTDSASAHAHKETSKQEKEGTSRPTKRQKRKEEPQPEISSTSDARAAETDAVARPPEKINGNETKQTPMEVDETDKQEDKQMDTKTDKTETAPTVDNLNKDTATATAAPTTKPDDPKPDQETTPAQKDQNQPEVANDVEMKQPEAEINGDPETEAAPEKVKTDVAVEKVKTDAAVEKVKTIDTEHPVGGSTA